MKVEELNTIPYTILPNISHLYGQASAFHPGHPRYSVRRIPGTFGFPLLVGIATVLFFFLCLLFRETCYPRLLIPSQIS